MPAVAKRPAKAAGPGASARNDAGASARNDASARARGRAKGFALDFSTGGRATLAWPFFFLDGRGSVRSTLSRIFSFISFFSCLSLCGLEQSHTSSSTPLPGRVRVLDRPPHRHRRHRRQRGRPPASSIRSEIRPRSHKRSEIRTISPFSAPFRDPIFQPPFSRA